MFHISRATMAAPIVMLALPPSAAQEAPQTVEAGGYTLSVQTVVDGLSHPWGLAFISDSQFLVTERNTGTIRLGDVDGTLSEPLWEADDLFRYEGETERSQAGLFDIKLHPDFEENGWAYISYSRETDHGAAVAIVRATVERAENDVSISGVEDIFEMKEEDQDSSGLHFGGRMAFDLNDNALYLTIGDRRNISRSQDAADQAGSVLRMTDEGEAHPDNPSFADEAEEGEPDPYLFAIGIRNIQALTVHPFTNEVWAVDHGPEGGDAIQLIAAGNNYGWPYITGGVDYSGAPMGVGIAMEGMISPVHVFEDTVAPSGTVFVPEGSLFGEWVGDLLVGGLVTEGVVRVTLDEGAVANVESIEFGHRVRDVHSGPDGALWLVTDEENGAVLRLSPE